MVDIAVDEEALMHISDMPEEIQDSVARILSVVKQSRSSEHFQPQTEIPDDAPTKVKNEVADGRGRVYCIGITFDDSTVLYLAWYEPYDRSLIVFYDIQYPIQVEITDE